MKTQPDRAQNPNPIAKTIAYYAAFIALGMVLASLGPTLPYLADNLRTTLSQISFLFTGRSLGYLIGSLAGGRLYDRIPGHLVMAVMLALMAAGMALVPAMPSVWALAAILLLVGIAMGGTDVGANLMLVWLHGRRVGPYLNGLLFFAGVGGFIAPVIVAQVLLAIGGVSWSYWVLAALILPAGLAVILQSSPPIRKSAASHERMPVNYLLVAFFAVFFFLYVGAESTFGGWLYTYALEMGLANESQAALMTSTFWISLMLGRLAAIPIAARAAPRSIVFSDLAGSLVALVAILTWRQSSAVVWAGTFLLGLCMASIIPTMLAFAEQRLHVTGHVTGWMFAGGSAGAMFIPWLVGQLFESSGPPSFITIILVDIAAATLVFVGLISYAGRYPASEPEKVAEQER
jgi:FHS family Na+ dependent glucose MFS transporter 1